MGIGYESVSSIVILAILVIMMLGLLPRRTLNSMKRVVRHGEDRYSSSLHLIDVNDGTRFSDEGSSVAKGADMQPTTRHTQETLNEHVSHVRRLRRQAIQRRRIVTIALAIATLAVVGLSYVAHFSAWYALIPTVLLLVVIAGGVHASRQARAWEAHIAHDASRTSVGHVQQQSGAVRERSNNGTDQVTAEMEQREIRRALHRARQEQAKPPASHPARAAAQQVRHEAAPKAVVPSDSTAQLHRVHPAAAVNAFDMAAIQPELISFSLGGGSQDSGDDTRARDAGPESLEIKSSRQVARAVPDSSAAEPKSHAADDEDAQAFHHEEEHAQVDVPSATADSLGTNIASILSRRVAGKPAKH